MKLLVTILLFLCCSVVNAQVLIGTYPTQSAAYSAVFAQPGVTFWGQYCLDFTPPAGAKCMAGNSHQSSGPGGYYYVAFYFDLHCPDDAPLNTTTGQCEAKKCESGSSSSAQYWRGDFSISSVPGHTVGSITVPTSLCDGQCLGTVVETQTSCSSSPDASPTSPSPVSCSASIKLTGDTCSDKFDPNSPPTYSNSGSGTAGSNCDSSGANPGTGTTPCIINQTTGPQTGTSSGSTTSKDGTGGQTGTTSTTVACDGCALESTQQGIRNSSIQIASGIQNANGKLDSINRSLSPDVSPPGMGAVGDGGIPGADLERENSLKDVGKLGQDNHDGLFTFDWSLSLPSYNCTPLSGEIGAASSNSHAFTWDWCQPAAKVREIGVYVLSLVTMWGLLMILTGKREGGV